MAALARVRLTGFSSVAAFLTLGLLLAVIAGSLKVGARRISTGSFGSSGTASTTVSSVTSSFIGMRTTGGGALASSSLIFQRTKSSFWVGAFPVLSLSLLAATESLTIFSRLSNGMRLRSMNSMALLSSRTPVRRDL